VKILVLNAGSSSIKYQLFEMKDNSVLASGLIEKIGEDDSLAKIKYFDKNGAEQKNERQGSIKNHDAALGIMSNLLIESGVIADLNELEGIGHRVVQGGSLFLKPTLVNMTVIDGIEKLIPLAPLHNPGHLAGMKVSLEQSPSVPQVAVFDTAFHATLPEYAYLYALPYKLFKEANVRRYGFHGTSHHFIVKEAAKYLHKPLNELNAITLHLGNGASMCAVKNGQSIDTTMGLTPLEGLVMGTRSGDIDPAILFYLARTQGYTIDALDKLLNKESGLKGICGNNDMREIGKMAQEGDEKAKLALEMFNYRIKKYIGAYSAVLGRVDCIIFTGGIGENDSDVRRNSCKDLLNLGIEIDEVVNNQRCSAITQISTATSPVKVLVIPTNEELEIALQTKEVIEAL
jgi:acetate kinase